METFFVGCTHYGHKNMVRGVSAWPSGYRDFDTIEEMNKVLVDNINSIVGQNDVLYSLGDWSFGGYKNIREFRSKINCQTVHLIAGNHDDHIRYDKNNELRGLFASYNELTEITLNKQKITLCHYPLAVWDKSHRGSWMLHSHNHGSFPDNTQQKRIDVGVDCEYLDWNGNLRMTTNFNKEPQSCGGYVNIDTNDPLCRKILHKRLTPFNFAELNEIMSYKEFKSVDHHNRKDMQ